HLALEPAVDADRAVERQLALEGSAASEQRRDLTLCGLLYGGNHGVETLTDPLFPCDVFGSVAKIVQKSLLEYIHAPRPLLGREWCSAPKTPASIAARTRAIRCSAPGSMTAI